MSEGSKQVWVEGKAKLRINCNKKLQRQPAAVMAITLTIYLMWLPLGRNKTLSEPTSFSHGQWSRFLTQDL